MCTATAILVSLRSATAQEAQQRLVAIFLVPPMILQVGAFLLVNRSRDLIASIDWMHVLLSTLVVLVTLNVAVVALALRRFQRSRLVLD